MNQPSPRQQLGNRDNASFNTKHTRAPPTPKNTNKHGSKHKHIPTDAAITPSTTSSICANAPHYGNPNVQDTPASIQQTHANMATLCPDIQKTKNHGHVTSDISAVEVGQSYQPSCGETNTLSNSQPTTTHERRPKAPNSGQKTNAPTFSSDTRATNTSTPTTTQDAAGQRHQRVRSERRLTKHATSKTN